MPSRDPNEAHRAATPLELLFDLITVIAIAAAAAELHHAIAELHNVQGIIGYSVTFFAIWWAWMNYTWFASAYDNDDGVFRMLTFLIMAGAFVLAAGVSRFAGELDNSIVVLGYIIMRVGMVMLWLRAAYSDPLHRRTALRYAVGILLAQVYWVATWQMAGPEAPYILPLLGLGVIIELSVPALAERGDATPWHRHHIMERYGLLMIIVLGEILLSAVSALQASWAAEFDIRQVHTALSALVICFAMWWMYFSREEHLPTNALTHALQWGYGHFFVFASAAAVGAGFGVLVDTLSGEAKTTVQQGDLAVAIPLAIYMMGLWFVRDRLTISGAAQWVLPVFALALCALPFAFPALEVIAALSVGAVILRALLIKRMAA